MTISLDTGDALPAALRDRWREESVASVWLRPGDWYHPAVDGLALALLCGTDALAPAEELGRARGWEGVGIRETIDDLTCLYRTTGRRTPPLDVLRALCDGWADGQAGTVVNGSCVDPESGLPTQQYLAVRLGEAYRDGGGVDHHLVLVDVVTGRAEPFARAARSAAVGAAMTSTFGQGHPMATLGGGVFAVLSRPGDDLAARVGGLQSEIARRVTELEARGITRHPVRIWTVPLPRTHEEAVQALARAARPVF